MTRHSIWSGCWSPPRARSESTPDRCADSPTSGLLATDDADAIIAAKPDCFCYCGTAVRREEQAIEDMARLLRAGIDVVTLHHPDDLLPRGAASWRDTIETACREGRSSFYGTGSEPGVASLNIPTALLAGAGQVDSYRMDEYAWAWTRPTRSGRFPARIHGIRKAGRPCACAIATGEVGPTTGGPWCATSLKSSATSWTTSISIGRRSRPPPIWEDQCGRACCRTLLP